jgi:hypothetical protein
LDLHCQWSIQAIERPMVSRGQQAVAQHLVLHQFGRMLWRTALLQISR